VKAIGRGGMGTVYLAEDVVLGREVALKVSSGDAGSDVTARLEREVRALARLEHPGIVPVHDAGTLPDGRAFYAMKLVRGLRLDEWTTKRDRRARLRLFQRVCEAVGFAHARDIIHRDLKPQNVMVGEFGEALVMDWGLARHQGVAELAPGGSAPPGAGVVATQAGAILGTPAFMAPEQARGEAVGPPADLYGLGAILYFLLTGRTPHDGPSVRAVLEAVGSRAPAPVRSLDPSIPPALAAVCDKAVAHAPEQRYRTATELADDVGRFLDFEPVLARRESLLEKAGRFAARNRVVLTLIAAYLLVRLIVALLP
jgi:serine/threonine protein kinase